MMNAEGRHGMADPIDRPETMPAQINRPVRTKQEFRREMSRLGERPKRALEVGAVPDERAMLACPEVADCPERIGINLNLTGTYQGIRVMRGDARELPYEDGSFDLVVSNSTLEHIPDFWRATADMRRVLRPGGTLMLCMPGYASHPAGDRVRRLFGRVPAPDLLRRGTVTMRVHDPVDCYRFGVDSFEQALLGGMEDIRVWTLMLPPRVFGTARKPAASR